MQREREQAPVPTSALTPTTDGIPPCGFRARRWARFERDLSEWLETPQGQFARWRAVHSIAPQHPTAN